MVQIHRLRLDCNCYKKPVRERKRTGCYEGRVERKEKRVLRGGMLFCGDELVISGCDWRWHKTLMLVLAWLLPHCPCSSPPSLSSRSQTPLPAYTLLQFTPTRQAPLSQLPGRFGRECLRDTVRFEQDNCHDQVRILLSPRPSSYFLLAIILQHVPYRYGDGKKVSSLIKVPVI